VGYAIERADGSDRKREQVPVGELEYDSARCAIELNVSCSEALFARSSFSRAGGWYLR
jgi:hypothetical protein